MSAKLDPDLNGPGAISRRRSKPVGTDEQLEIASWLASSAEPAFASL